MTGRGFYSTRVLPHVIHVIMAAEPFTSIRRTLLSSVTGHTLEIGFGSGLNLEHYPPTVNRVTGVDVNPGMNRLAARRIESTSTRPDLRVLDCQSLPFDDECFDSVVSTWSLCSIGDPRLALHEVRRVLKFDGRFFFAEHGLSTEPHIRKWQRRLTPLQRRIAGGCHLDRDISALIRETGLDIVSIETCYLDGVPRVSGFLYKGVATRSVSCAVRP